MNTKLNSLNGLKGLMVWSIVLYHTYRAANPISNFFSIYGGDIGNQFFFAISGFLTCYSFIQNNKIREGFTRWFSRKLLRIYPAYAFFNLVALLSIGVSSVSLSDIILVFSMQTGGALSDLYPFVFPGWFFCTLIFCFCLFYLANYISNNTIFKSNYIYILLIAFGLILQTKKFDFPYLFFHDGYALVPFFIGCLICSEYEHWKKNQYICYLISVIFVAISFFTSVGDIYMVLSFIFIPPALLICIENKLINLLFNNFIATFLSKISIYVCLSHTLIFFVRGLEISYLYYLATVFIGSSISYVLDQLIRKGIKYYLTTKKAPYL